MPEVFVTIEDGKIVNYKAFEKWLKDHRNGRHLIKSERKNKRTLSQNAYYHSVVCACVMDCLRDAGYNEVKTTVDVHEILKYKFLKKQIPNEHGEFIEFVGSTTKLSTIEFGDYLEDIFQWVSESFGVSIPAPNTQTMFSYDD